MAELEEGASGKPVLEEKDLGAHKKGFVGAINTRLFTQLVD